MREIIYQFYLFARYTFVSRLWPHMLCHMATMLERLKIITGREPISLSDIDKIKRILIIGPNGLGDCILFSTAMKRIRETFQTKHITILSRPVVKDYLLSCPYVDRVLVYDQKRFTITTVWKCIKFLQFLRHERFDLVINALWMSTEISGLLTFITGAPLRVGCVYFQPFLATMRTGILFTHCLEIGKEKHAFEYYMDLLGCLNIHPPLAECQPEVWSTSADCNLAVSFAKDALSNAKYIVAIAPGAGSPVRQWPTTSYAEVADYCMRHYQAMVVLLGGPGDVRLAAEITGAMTEKPINLAGKASFAQTGEILKRCHLFIGNDSGPMHLAAAAGVPVIALFSSGNYIHFAPYGDGHQIIRQDLPCYPCYGQCIFHEPVCLTTIMPDEVIRRIRKILDTDVNFIKAKKTADVDRV